MQREHVAYALGRVAAKRALLGDFISADMLYSLAFDDGFIESLAESLRVANENQSVNDAITERIIREQRARRGGASQ